MFNTKTGEVNCNGFILRQDGTREEFLTSENGRDAQLIVENEGWSSYRFSVDQKTFFVLQFKNDVIDQIRIALALEGSDPNQWTNESEASRRSLHDQILRDELGASPYQYSWGKIESLHDMKNGASQIIVSYT